MSCSSPSPSPWAANPRPADGASNTTSIISPPFRSRGASSAGRFLFAKPVPASTMDAVFCRLFATPEAGHRNVGGRPRPAIFRSNSRNPRAHPEPWASRTSDATLPCLKRAAGRHLHDVPPGLLPSTRPRVSMQRGRAKVRAASTVRPYHCDCSARRRPRTTFQLNPTTSRAATSSCTSTDCQVG